MPSFHFGWILLVGIALIQTNRAVLARVLGVLLPLIMLLAIILTANHYVLDAVAGGVLVLAALGVVVWFEHMRETWPRRHAGHPASLR